LCEHTSDLSHDAKVAYALSLFRDHRITHAQLSRLLELDRFETDSLLKKHGVTEQGLTLDDVRQDLATLDRLLGTPAK